MTSRRYRWLVVCAALLAGAACGGDDDGGDAVDAICATYVDCGVAGSSDECSAFFDQVFTDLEERCDNAAEVSELYRESLRCVADAECDDLFSGICQEEREAYEQALMDGGEGCQPDDD